MFSGFPAELKKRGLSADVRTVLHIHQLMSHGLIHNMGTLYSLAERLVVKDPRQKGPYTVAFFAHFLEIDIKQGQLLDEAVMLSDVFYNWRIEKAPGELPSPKLVAEFLEYIFNRSFRLDAAGVPLEEIRPEGLISDVPFAPLDKDQEDADTDHSDKDLEEIVRRMREIAKEQDEAHSGGRKFIGNKGRSPYGHNGRASSGVRVAGESTHMTARMVLNDPRYFPLDMNEVLSDGNTDAALAALKGIADHSSKVTLDIDETVRMGARRAGLFLPHLKKEDEEQLSVMLFIDNGGYSMDPYVPNVRALFQKMNIRYGHDLRIFYFHNIIGPTVYKDPTRTKYPVATDALLNEGRHHSVFFIGDASMSPNELNGYGARRSGFDRLREFAAAFPRLVWLNPVKVGYWAHTETIEDIRTVIHMFPLTPRGIERAVAYMNQFSPRRTAEV
jgi:uncharacterized protein